MTQEDKFLLLQDLSARFPYHPFAYGKSGYACNKGRLILVTSSGCTIMTGGGSRVHYFFNEIKLYLRPMSSMTEEEMYEYNTAIDKDVAPERFVDWYNLHHFDYRGLIEKGLALEAPKDMYK